PIGNHPDEAVPVPRQGPAGPGVARGSPAAHPAGIVGVEDAARSPRRGVLALARRRARVERPVDDGELEIDLVGHPLPVHAPAVIRRRHVAGAVHRHRALHAVIPQRLFPVEPGRVDQPALERERAALRRIRREGVLEAKPKRVVGRLGVVPGIAPKRWTSTVTRVVTPPANRPRTFTYARVISKLLKWLTESFN